MRRPSLEGAEEAAVEEGQEPLKQVKQTLSPPGETGVAKHSVHSSLNILEKEPGDLTPDCSCVACKQDGGDMLTCRRLKLQLLTRLQNALVRTKSFHHHRPASPLLIKRVEIISQPPHVMMRSTNLGTINNLFSINH
jgi:hypothetical protein